MGARWARAVSVAWLIALPQVVLAESVWYQTPFRIETKGPVASRQSDVAAPLDMAERYSTDDYDPPENLSSDSAGHAGPYMIDLDGDGKRDLIVGGFSGMFRFYRNVGTDDDARFTSRFTFLQAGDTVARVPIDCCVAPSPQFVDIDGDGVPDLLSGCYAPGYIYWFRGLGGGKFAARQALLDDTGTPVRYPAEPGPGPGGMSVDFRPGTTGAMTDWNDDGKQDLLIGTIDGQLFVTLNVAQDVRDPVFSSSFMEVRIGGKSALEEGHAAVTVEDWDGDGLWDIVLGGETGAVYWLRNSGRRGSPKFQSRQQLIGPGEGVEQWLEPIGPSRSADVHVEPPRRGIRAQVQVLDYNRDGKPDILLGDWSTSMTPSRTLSADEVTAMKKLRNRIDAIDSQAGWPRLNWRHKYDGYLEYMEPDAAGWQEYRYSDQLLLVQELRQQLSFYLEHYKSPNIVTDDVSDTKAHGLVWVFLHK